MGLHYVNVEPTGGGESIQQIEDGPCQHFREVPEVARLNQA
jgi:hypothetical protein